MSRPPFPSGWSAIPISPKNLMLANTLPVGQSFLWHRHTLPTSSQSLPGEEFARAVNHPPRVVCLRQTSTHLYYTAVHGSQEDAELDKERGLTRAWLDDYFHLRTQPDLEGLYDGWRARDPALFGKVEVDGRAVGVRVLRQDPWECLIADMGFGYRASFIESTLQSLLAEFGDEPGRIETGLLSWRDLDVEVVREKLIALKGVGRKVADCVMLMCMDKVGDTKLIEG
ncbi:hypothetical protein IAR55_000352 [Kwoniella newhampshirensis]|uniref:8-oxoguanine DNA glycosylase N-terminal domain-containing protein n=1 Tax=Kwoniella newhampshirensis TaxID=1651941 RepID=A0AAW0Z6D0_9TREE